MNLYDFLSGTKPYFEESHTGRRFAAIHDHGDTERTVGLGEVVAVLNGVQFTTRHNDYLLKAPAKNRDFLSMEDIPLPSVPPSVLKKVRGWGDVLRYAQSSSSGIMS